MQALPPLFFTRVQRSYVTLRAEVQRSYVTLRAEEGEEPGNEATTRKEWGILIRIKRSRILLRLEARDIRR